MSKRKPPLTDYQKTTYTLEEQKILKLGAHIIRYEYSEDQISTLLRSCDIPIIGYVKEGKNTLNLRTIRDRSRVPRTGQKSDDCSSPGPPPLLCPFVAPFRRPAGRPFTASCLMRPTGFGASRVPRAVTPVGSSARRSNFAVLTRCRGAGTNWSESLPSAPAGKMKSTLPALSLISWYSRLRMNLSMWTRLA